MKSEYRKTRLIQSSMLLVLIVWQKSRAGVNALFKKGMRMIISDLLCRNEEKILRLLMRRPFRPTKRIFLFFREQAARAIPSTLTTLHKISASVFIIFSSLGGKQIKPFRDLAEPTAQTNPHNHTTFYPPPTFMLKNDSSLP